jgi:hypothetical protein
MGNEKTPTMNVAMKVENQSVLILFSHPSVRFSAQKQKKPWVW